MTLNDLEGHFGDPFSTFGCLLISLERISVGCILEFCAQMVFGKC